MLERTNEPAKYLQNGIDRLDVLENLEHVRRDTIDIKAVKRSVPIRIIQAVDYVVEQRRGAVYCQLFLQYVLGLPEAEKSVAPIGTRT